MLKNIEFDNRMLNCLPVDRTKNVFPRRVSNAIFSQAIPEPVSNPKLIAISADSLLSLGVEYQSDHDLPAEQETELALYFSGNRLLRQSRPHAHCYCGYQFGIFAGQLGDGAAISLGEVICRIDVPATSIHDFPLKALTRNELQIKGAGVTPYSRNADGRKVLRSSIREFLCSEAMHYLNIPTVRVGSLVTSDTYVDRDQYYDGHITKERCTVVSRIAPNFFRFGSFEIFKPIMEGESPSARTGPSEGNEVLKKKLLEHALLYFLEEVDAYNIKHRPDLYRQELEHQRLESTNKKFHSEVKGVNVDDIGVNVDDIVVNGSGGIPIPVESGKLSPSGSEGDSFSLQQSLLEVFFEDDKPDFQSTPALSRRSSFDESGNGIGGRKRAHDEPEPAPPDPVEVIDNAGLTIAERLVKMQHFVHLWPGDLRHRYQSWVKKLQMGKVTCIACVPGEEGARNCELVQTYLIFYCEIMWRTVKLVAQWQSVGFIHGVLNTDNMSIMGLTIDYGPFAFMEMFDAEFVSNGSDSAGRYCFSNQPAACKWNLKKFAESLCVGAGLSSEYSLVPLEATSNCLQACYDGIYEECYVELMCRKLGLVYVVDGDMEEDDKALVTELMHCFAMTGKDYNDCFVALTEFVMELDGLVKGEYGEGRGNLAAHCKTVDVEELLRLLVHKMASRTCKLDERIQNLIRKLKIHKLSMHPQQILELHALIVQQPPNTEEVLRVLGELFKDSNAPIPAIMDEIIIQKQVLNKLQTISGDLEAIENDLTTFSKEDIEHKRNTNSQNIWFTWSMKYYKRLLKEWNLQADPNSINSIFADEGGPDSEPKIELCRIMSPFITESCQLMKTTNPTFILRNWVAHEVIEAAEKGDYSQFHYVHALLKDPYNYDNSIFKRKNATAVSAPVPVTTPAVTQSSCSANRSSSADAVDSSSSNNNTVDVSAKYISLPPEYAHSLICTCSS